MFVVWCTTAAVINLTAAYVFSLFQVFHTKVYSCAACTHSQNNHSITLLRGLCSFIKKTIHICVLCIAMIYRYFSQFDLVAFPEYKRNLDRNILLSDKLRCHLHSPVIFVEISKDQCHTDEITKLNSWVSERENIALRAFQYIVARRERRQSEVGQPYTRSVQR